MHRPPTASAIRAELAVQSRLQVQVATALAAYGARHGALPEAAFSALTKLPDHLWPTKKLGLAAANAFIRDHGARLGIAPFDDAKAILHAAYGQGGALSAERNSLGKLERRQANQQAERFFAETPKGRPSKINAGIADYLIGVLEKLTGKKVTFTRDPLTN
jgi:hypothetical protein